VRSEVDGVPTTTVLDDFNRANNGDLGANWTPHPFNHGGLKQFELTSNALRSPHSEAYSSEWYHPTTYGPDVEAYITVVARPSGSFSSRLDARLVNPSAGSATANSYRLGLAIRNGVSLLEVV
jgi:hypothetical protein